MDFSAFLLRRQEPFDIVFLDPPYRSGLLEKALPQVAAITSPGGTIIAEHPTDEELPEYDNELYRHKKMKTDPEKGLALLQEVLPLLEAQEDYSNDALYALLCGFAKEKGYKNGQILWPIRTALSGKQMTPAGATEILEVLGKEESLNRLRAAVEKLR